MYASKWQGYSTGITHVLERSSVDIKNCLGQQFEGARNMPSKVEGAEKQIATACKSIIIQDASNIVKKVTMMFVKVIFWLKRHLIYFKTFNYNLRYPFNKGNVFIHYQHKILNKY